MLVDANGNNIKDEDYNDPDEGHIPFFKDSDEPEQTKKNLNVTQLVKKTDLNAIRKIVTAKYKKVKINIDGS